MAKGNNKQYPSICIDNLLDKLSRNAKNGKLTERQQEIFPMSAKSINVIQAIASSADNDTWDCFPSYELLTIRTGYSKPTVANAIRELTELNLLSRTARYSGDGGYRTSTNYQLNKDYILSFLNAGSKSKQKEQQQEEANKGEEVKKDKKVVNANTQTGQAQSHTSQNKQTGKVTDIRTRIETSKSNVEQSDASDIKSDSQDNQQQEGGENIKSHITDEWFRSEIVPRLDHPEHPKLIFCVRNIFLFCYGSSNELQMIKRFNFNSFNQLNQDLWVFENFEHFDALLHGCESKLKKRREKQKQNGETPVEIKSYQYFRTMIKDKIKENEEYYSDKIVQDWEQKIEDGTHPHFERYGNVNKGKGVKEDNGATREDSDGGNGNEFEPADGWHRKWTADEDEQSQEMSKEEKEKSREWRHWEGLVFKRKARKHADPDGYLPRTLLSRLGI